MIPIRDHNPSGRFPFVNYVLIAVNVLVFGYMFLLPETALDTFIRRWALIPAGIAQGQNLITLFTSMFLHGGIGHLLGNMLFLNIFGDNLEDRFGHLGYLIFYLICGLGATGLQFISNPGSAIPNLGASGAIAGAMGGYLVLFPRHRVDVLFTFGFSLQEASVPAYTMLFYWFIAQLFSGVGSFGMDAGGVAYLAHVGGFVSGYLITRIAGRGRS